MLLQKGRITHSALGGEHSCVMESCIRAKNNLHDAGAGVGCILAEKVEAEEE